MYDIFTYLWLICMVNVGKYTIHPWILRGTIPNPLATQPQPTNLPIQPRHGREVASPARRSLAMALKEWRSAQLLRSEVCTNQHEDGWALNQKPGCFRVYSGDYFTQLCREYKLAGGNSNMF